MKTKQNQGAAKHSEVQFVTKMLLLHQDMYSKQELERIFNVDKRNFTHALEKSERQKRKQQLAQPLDDYFAIADWYRTLDTRATLEKLGNEIKNLLMVNARCSEGLTIFSNDVNGKWLIHEKEAEAIAEIPRHYLQELLDLHIIEKIQDDEKKIVYQVDLLFSELMEMEFFAGDESVMRSELLSYLFFCLKHPYSVYGFWFLQKLQQYYPEAELLPKLEFRYLTPSLLLSQRLVTDPIMSEAIATNQAITFTYRQIKKQGEDAEKISVSQFWPLHVLSDGRTGRVYVFGAEANGETLRYAKPIIAESIEIKSIQLIEHSVRSEVIELRLKQASGFETSFLYPNFDSQVQTKPELYALKFQVPEHETRESYEALVRYQLGEEGAGLAAYQELLKQEYPEDETTFLIFGVIDDVTRIIPWIRSFGRHCQIVAGTKLRQKFIEVLEDIRKERMV